MDKKRLFVQAIGKHLPGVLMVVALLAPSSGFSQKVHESGTVIESFLAHDAHAKPMARMWFPDASAGEDPNDYIEKQISELAAKGFGGVEVAMIMTNGVRYDNKDARIYGWGTDNWIKLMKKVLKAAAKVAGGFQVDATITSHWPPLLNTIDPNDEAASKELSFSITPITADDVESGTIRLRLPLQRTTAPSSTFGRVTDVDFGMQALGKWCDIGATSEQLRMLGVSHMQYVSGTSEYTLSFTLPDNFGQNDGAFITYSYGRDQVGALIVNGTELPANNASDRVDVGRLLAAGKNTLTIRLNTTLYGRTYYEHSGYLDKGVVYGMGEGVLNSPVPGTYFNGLLSVSIIPYVATTTDDHNAVYGVPADDSQPAPSLAAIYNLKGQPLGSAQRGVNIVGGKKIVVK